MSLSTPKSVLTGPAADICIQCEASVFDMNRFCDANKNAVRICKIISKDNHENCQEEINNAVLQYAAQQFSYKMHTKLEQHEFKQFQCLLAETTIPPNSMALLVHPSFKDWLNNNNNDLNGDNKTVTQHGQCTITTSTTNIIAKDWCEPTTIHPLPFEKIIFMLNLKRTKNENENDDGEPTVELDFVLCVLPMGEKWKSFFDKANKRPTHSLYSYSSTSKGDKGIDADFVSK
jgi:hypothetical protein